MQFDLVTPEKLIVSTQADYINLPGTEGYFGVLDGHQATLATLNAGVIEVRTGSETVSYKISGGFVDVDATKVTVLADALQDN